MIDVEPFIFDHVYQTVAPLLPEGGFRSVYVPSAPVFPFATLMEMNNTTDRRRRSTAEYEEFALLTYEANVWAADRDTCKTIMDALDGAMTQLGFSRDMMTYVPNLADSTIFRYVARYSAEAGADNIIYRRR